MMLSDTPPLKPKTADIHIRPMCMEDIPQVQTIDQASFSLPWPQSAFIFELKQNPNARLWVAEKHDPVGNPQALEHGGIVVGMVVVWHIIDEAHIATLAVHPDYRTQRIGTRLLVTSLLDAIQTGMHQATLEVRLSNLAAQNLYLKYGFEIVGKRLRYYKDNQEDAVIMTNNHLDSAYASWLVSLNAQGVSNE
jgi:ribosomal-protein-alanine N-acetyltransferase